MDKIKYYVINLKRRPDRFELFKKNYPLDITQIIRFDAIDGKLLDNIPEHFKNLKKSEVGCFLSHLLLWQKILKTSDSEYNVIFEDDPIFSENFYEEFKNLQTMNIDFNILYIGGRWIDNFKMKTCVKVNNKIVKYDYNKPWNPLDCDRCTFGYIITKKCCSILLEHFNKIINTDHNLPKNTFRPIDHFILDVLREKN